MARKFNKIARSLDGLRINNIRDGDIDDAVYKAFEYRHLGNLAYVGNSAVFDLGDGWNVAGGLWAVYAWRFVYFSQSVGIRTRILMAMDWAKRSLFGRGEISPFVRRRYVNLSGYIANSPRYGQLLIAFLPSRPAASGPDSIFMRV